MLSRSHFRWIVLISLIFFGTIACMPNANKSSTPASEGGEGAARHVNGQDAFKAEVTDYKGIVLVDFGAHWCPPCRALAPSLDRLATEMGDRIKVIKVYDEDQGVSNDTILSKYGITNLPTLIIFKDGEKVKSSVGGRSYDDLNKWVTDALNELGA